jgi:hypothetical protein
VKTRAGLFCRKKLGRDLSKYPVPDVLQRMLHCLERWAPTYWMDEEYYELFNNK